MTVGDADIAQAGRTAERHSIRVGTGRPALSAQLLLPGLVAALAAVTILRVWMRDQPDFAQMLDLEVYWDGGRALRTGHHLYTAQYTWVHLPFTYPPFAAFVFAVASHAKLKTMKLAMTAASVAGLFAVSWLSWGRLGHRPSAGRLGAALLVGAAALWSEPVQQTLSFGQVNILLMVAVVADLCLPDRALYKGVGVGLAAGFKLVPAIFIPYLLLTRRYRAAGVATATLAATIAGGFVLRPIESGQYWGGLFFDSGRAGYIGYVGNQSLHGMIDRLFHGGSAVQPVWMLSAVLVAAAGLLLAAREHRRGNELLAIVVTATVGLLASPISWSHHWVWVLPALVAAVDWAWRQAHRGWLVAVPLGLFLLFAAWPQRVNATTLPTGIIWRVPFDVNGNEAEYTWHGLQTVQGELYSLVGLAFLGVLGVLALRGRAARRAVPPAARDTGGAGDPAAAGERRPVAIPRQLRKTLDDWRAGKDGR